MTRKVIWKILALMLVITTVVDAQRLTVSDNGRFLVKDDGEPFFWLGDTAWELFHRCDRDEVIMYLNSRQRQGFNVIHAVALAEIDGLHTPSAMGELPLIDSDPERPNEKYFEHVDFVLEEAGKRGMYIALLPTWGDKVFRNSWGVGPEVFNAENAYSFGKWMGERYASYDHVIWIIGGDRNPRPDTDDEDIWRAMASGVVEAAGGIEETIMSFHPQPKEDGGSSTWFHEDDWLDFNMHQTGHCPRNTYLNIRHDYNLKPVKPVLDGEPLYEDHPICFNAKELGHSFARDIRRIMYWNVFAGACGQSYGCHDIWQMYDLDKDPINQPLRPWKQALDLPMANQVAHLKNLMLSRPYLSRIPDQSIVIDQQIDDTSYVISTRDTEGKYAMVYYPTGKVVSLDISSLTGDQFDTWWYDPRTGISFEGNVISDDTARPVPPSSGYGNDWVLVIDAASEEFTPPGQ